MSTYTDLQNSISDKLMRTDLSSQIAEEINSSIQFYTNERFWFNETQSTFSTVSGQKAYGTSDGLPTNIKSIDSIKYAIATNNYIFPYEVPFRKIEVDDPAGATGQPREWAFYQQQLYFYPIPNGVYTITISYQKNYSDLSSGTDTNDFTTNTLAKDLIVARTLRTLYEVIIMDAQQAAVQEKRELEFLDRLRKHSSKLMSSTKRFTAYGYSG